jgi:hypothetical protein
MPIGNKLDRAFLTGIFGQKNQDLCLVSLRRVAKYTLMQYYLSELRCCKPSFLFIQTQITALFRPRKCLPENIARRCAFGKESPMAEHEFNATIQIASIKATVLIAL